MKNKFFGNLVLFITAIIWGSSFVAQRKGMDFLGPFTYVAARYLLSFIFIYVLFIYSKKKKKVEDIKRFKGSSVLSGIICGLFLFTGTILQQYGIVYSTASKAGFITVLYIVIVPILAAILLKDKISIQAIVCVVIAVIGFYFLSIKSDFTISKGDILLFIGSIMWAMHIIAVAKFAKNSDTLVLISTQFFVTFFISLIFAFIFEEINISDIEKAIIPILYAGVLSGGVGFSLQIVGQKYTNPTVASLILSLESVFAAIGGALILNEVLTTRELIGCIIIFVAVIFAQIPFKSKERVAIEE